jgi:hypothetical protein
MCCNINDFTPHRAGQHSVFTSAENRCTHVGKNKNRHMIRQFKVDGEVVAAGDMSPRCDYLLLNDDAKTSYYIELKGSDLVKAIEQIETTVAMIAPPFRNMQSCAVSFSERVPMEYKPGPYSPGKGSMEIPSSSKSGF